MSLLLKRRSVLPGFGLSLGTSLFYLGLVVIIPLSTLFFKAATLSWGDLVSTLTSPRVLASFRLTFFASFVAAVLNAIFGLLVAWVLVRYSFPGKQIIDGFVDLPFALPTAVAGITLTSVYSPNGWIGKPLAALGIKPVFTPLGIIIALTFIGLPFVVRTVQPVLEDMDKDMEEAAVTLGASRLQTARHVLFPLVWPALLTGFTLAFARALGEYGSVVFISGNMPMRTEIVPLLIMSKLEQFDYAGATALAVMMLLISFALILMINGFQLWSRRQKAQI